MFYRALLATFVTFALASPAAADDFGSTKFWKVTEAVEEPDDAPFSCALVPRVSVVDLEIHFLKTSNEVVLSLVPKVLDQEWEKAAAVNSGLLWFDSDRPVPVAVNFSDAAGTLDIQMSSEPFLSHLTSGEFLYVAVEGIGLVGLDLEGSSEAVKLLHKCKSRSTRPFFGEGSKLNYGSREGMQITVRAVSGLNTDFAKIEGEVTREDAIAACDQGTGSYTEECVIRRLADGPLRMSATANCISGIFSNMYGEKHQFLGVNSGKYATSEKFALMNLATGEVANGSMASGYPVNLDIFAALCPEYVPAR